MVGVLRVRERKPLRLPLPHIPQLYHTLLPSQSNITHSPCRGCLLVGKCCKWKDMIFRAQFLAAFHDEQCSCSCTMRTSMRSGTCHQEDMDFHLCSFLQVSMMRHGRSRSAASCACCAVQAVYQAAASCLPANAEDLAMDLARVLGSRLPGAQVCLCSSPPQEPSNKQAKPGSALGKHFWSISHSFVLVHTGERMRMCHGMGRLILGSILYHEVCHTLVAWSSGGEGLVHLFCSLPQSPWGL